MEVDQITQEYQICHNLLTLKFFQTFAHYD